MRTNIDIDDQLMAEALRRSGTKTKRGAVEEALRFFVQVKAQSDLRQLRGIGWEGDLDAMRTDR